MRLARITLQALGDRPRQEIGSRQAEMTPRPPWSVVGRAPLRGGIRPSSPRSPNSLGNADGKPPRVAFQNDSRQFKFRDTVETAQNLGYKARQAGIEVRRIDGIVMMQDSDTFIEVPFDETLYLKDCLL